MCFKTKSGLYGSDEIHELLPSPLLQDKLWLICTILCPLTSFRNTRLLRVRDTFGSACF